MNTHASIYQSGLVVWSMGCDFQVYVRLRRSIVWVVNDGFCVCVRVSVVWVLLFRLFIYSGAFVVIEIIVCVAWHFFLYSLWLHTFGYCDGDSDKSYNDDYHDALYFIKRFRPSKPHCMYRWMTNFILNTNRFDAKKEYTSVSLPFICQCACVCVCVCVCEWESRCKRYTTVAVHMNQRSFGGNRNG